MRADIARFTRFLGLEHDAASGDMEAGLLVAEVYTTEEGQLSQDSSSRDASIQTTGETQDAACASTMAVLNRHGETDGRQRDFSPARMGCVATI